MFEKVSRSLKYDSNFFLSTNIYNIYIIWTPALITLPMLVLRVRGNKMCGSLDSGSNSSLELVAKNRAI